MIPEKDCQNPYYPEPPLAIPLPHPSQDPHLSDHATIRKLLVKLGGRFSDDDHQQPDDDGTNLRRSLHTSTTQFPYQKSSLNYLVSSSSSMSFVPNPCYPTPPDWQCYTDDVFMHHLVQGSCGDRVELHEMNYHNGPRFEGLDCFCGTAGGNEGSGTNLAESTGWGDASSLPYPPPLVSNYGFYQQGMLQESVFGDAEYPASQ